ncbi:SymE family type I addiction module toxin [Acerihabitans sp. TG2]|uniref:SymE family type I addiction module toxin n=1 Tax=Acerihabitans sp. TG2 TaxID=3096008 RepID=UPI002B228264|nr:SymE family type I addiction module toxin [Acerihabitans sp. TG2]MEA9393609.1 SymE family type I addiction module toxin [Acerihabitans sp. TG2]
MAEHDSKSKPGISKAQRRLKVGYISIRHQTRATKMLTYYSRSPSLHLKGNWLIEAGFATDQPVQVTVEPGVLIIHAMTDK